MLVIIFSSIISKLMYNAIKINEVKAKQSKGRQHNYTQECMMYDLQRLCEVASRSPTRALKSILAVCLQPIATHNAPVIK
jgi:hypothetical protein